MTNDGAKGAAPDLAFSLIVGSPMTGGKDVIEETLARKAAGLAV